MRAWPAVTIAIPTYNRIAYIRQAVQSALLQSYPAIEVIVSDNCSDDGTAEAVSALRDPRLVFLRQKKNLGMIGNWNACLERASGDFFLLLSDDDLLESQAIEKMVGAIVDVPEPDRVGVCYARTWLIGARGQKLGLEPIPPRCEDALAFGPEYFAGRRPIYPVCTLVRTADLRRIGGYNQGSVTLAVDAIAFSRILLERGLIVGVPEAVAYYRIHPASASSSSPIGMWQSDIRALIALWSAAFESSPRMVRRRLQRAAMRYESWNIAANINKSADSWRTRLGAISAYYSCRSSFPGLIGKCNWVGGVIKLLLPELLKRQLRSFVLWRRKPALARCGGGLAHNRPAA